MIAPVMSLAHLRTKAKGDVRYRNLVFLAAQKFDFDPSSNDLDDALAHLQSEALASGEEEVTEEVNALRNEV